MSLFGVLTTSVSGMSAQAGKLSTIGDNIANASTTGYKRASTEFETLLGNAGTSDYQSGGVVTQVRYAITDPGTIESTTSSTDLAIKDGGFFVVQDNSGGQALTRAGSFIKQTNGTLLNTSGYTLMGYSLTNGTNQSGSSGLVPINVGSSSLVASASKAATLSVNVPSTATTVVAANLPSTNSATATYTEKGSLTAYDNLGTPITLDIYMTKSGTTAGPPSTSQWEVSIYNKATAAAGGGFPYTSAALKTQTVNFDNTTGNVASGGALSVQIPNGNAVSIDMSGSTQLDSGFATNVANIDGSSPATLSKVTIAKDGTVTQVYSNGVQKATYQVALGTVSSPDLLTPESGDAYTTNSQSGSIIVATPAQNGLGTILSSSLESSTVDLATELTNMISAQRGYEANSKVLQTASDLLGVINNLNTGG